MSFSDALGDRMKEYENVTRSYLPRRTYTIIRVDGRSFHNITSNMHKPFDYKLIDVMGLVAIGLCNEIQGSVMAYQQSDEISILCQDFENIHTQAWFRGNLNKIISLSAAHATALFNFYADRENLNFIGLATFDSRAFTVTSRIEVMNYFIWRQKDAMRNSISMLAHSNFSHKSLQGLSSKQLQEKLWSEKTINWNAYPSAAKRGQVIRKMAYPQPCNWPDRYFWGVDLAAPDFVVAEGNFLDNIIPRISDL